MLAVYLEKPRKIKIKEVPKPEIRNPEDVLIKVMTVGICGSDLHYYQEGKIGIYVVEKPMILGHEASGKVVEIGKKVKRVKVGDKAAIEPGVSCGQCDFCNIGRYNLCPNVQFMATPPIDGALAEYVIHPESFVYKLPEQIDFEDGALIEPASVGLHALDLVSLKPADKILILGAGPIGLATLLFVKISGARAALSDINNFRLKIAGDMGAEILMNSQKENVTERINLWTEGKGVKICFEAVGIPETTNLAFELTEPGGTVVGIGLGYQGKPALDVQKLIWKEIKFQGLQRYCHTYPRIIELLAGGALSLKKLVTHRFPFEKVIEAFDFAVREKEKSIKVMVNF